MRVSALNHSGPDKNPALNCRYSQQLSAKSFINNNYYSNNTWTKPRGLDRSDRAHRGQAGRRVDLLCHSSMGIGVHTDMAGASPRLTGSPACGAHGRAVAKTLGGNREPYGR